MAIIKGPEYIVKLIEKYMEITKMKKMYSVIIVCLFLLLPSYYAKGEGFLPLLEQSFGIGIPSVEKCLGGRAKHDVMSTDGRDIVEYSAISFEDYSK